MYQQSYLIKEVEEGMKDESVKVKPVVMNEAVTSEDVTGKQKEKNVDNVRERQRGREVKGSNTKERAGCDEEEKQKHDVK